ncbi:MAG: hypothetical protein Q9186_001897 [Xanthomendoza sp. 1 TL-2023]
MDPTRKRKRRQFSDAEKEHIKRVRKIGACLTCKLKKCKCTHVPAPNPDPPSPLTSDTEDNEPITPESGHMPDLNGFLQEAATKVYSFEDMLNSDFL